VAWMRSAGAHMRACSVAFAASIALSLAPYALLRWTATSGGWLFRDPMVFWGLLAGGFVLQRALDSPAQYARPVVWALLALQLVQQGATIRIGLRRYAEGLDQVAFYRHQGQPVDLGRTLVEQARVYGPRVYLSDRAQFLTRSGLTPYGVHAVTDLVFLGLNPVNAWFKGVSMDRLAPSPRSMHGFIAGEREVIVNGPLLDVLGVDMVLTTAGEGPAPADLVALDQRHVQTFRGDADLMLLGNPGAWPDAVLLDSSAREMALPVRDGCPHEGALCRDYTQFAGTRLDDHVSVTATNGEYRVHIDPAPRERLLFLSATYRPEWRASSNSGALAIDAIGGAFIGVTIPPGAADVDVAFVPRMRIALAWFSGVTCVVLIATLCFLTVKRRGADVRHASA
jgi:hypothetical protein